jgi:hypothetical protein
MKKYIKLSLFIFAFLSIRCSIFAQLFPEKNIVQNYYTWPVQAKIGIVANFGELRPNHYHMGLDCRTESRENMPILAAADGYVAKINIDPTGFGRAIYINHPNGTTTLYAHLNDFNPVLEKFIREQQYKLKQWKIVVEIPANQFKVKKGEFIAFSGNTGGSQGPHLHFEIRDTKTDKVLNPLLYGFPIEDNIAPNIIRLAVYDRRFSTYEQTPKIFPLKKINGVYQPIGGKITVNTDLVSFAITAFDSYTNSTNQNGIYRAELYFDNKTISGFEMDSTGYNETRYLNAHIDYKTHESGGPFLQQLSPLLGYKNGIYKTAKGEDGLIRLTDNESHEIKIAVSDANGNQSELKFELTKTDQPIKTINVETSKMFRPNMVNIFENESIWVYLKDSCLYDSFHFKLKELPGKIFQVQDDKIPVHCYFQTWIKGDFATADTSKIVMKQVAHGRQRFKKAVYKKGWYNASFRDFGTYQLLKDTTPPVVAPVGGFRNGINAKKLNRIAFSVSDNSVDIANFTALLDGEWILCSNDKGKVFVYEFDEKCTPGEHNLQIIVTDLVGNKTVRNYQFVR